MKYIERNPLIINAILFRGDLTEELKSLGFSLLNDNSFCGHCNQLLTKHICINNQIICPNNYIIYNKNGFQIMSKENFEFLYKPLLNFQNIVDISEN